MFHLSLSRDRRQHGSLVDQVVDGIAATINQRIVPAGATLPSVRAFAKQQSLSPYTIAEAYQRLAAMGLIVARAGAGYKVADTGLGQWQPPPVPPPMDNALSASWLLSDVFADRQVPIKAGCGWMPGDWVNDAGLQHALRRVSRSPGARMGRYGHPYGWAALREHIAATLRRWSLRVDAGQILLTQGVTQGLDLVVRTLLRAGDTVLVEDPGYCNLLQILKLAGVNVVSVPRTVDGFDIATLEQAISTHRPKALFVNTVLQNPSGTSLTVSAAFRLLQAADRHGIWVVEDDISRELAPAGAPMLAAMAGLDRVIYLSGFSKTITPAVRVGYVAASPSVVSQLALTKMAVGLTSSEITERAVANVLVEGHYERHVVRLQERLAAAHDRVSPALLAAGLKPMHLPRAGLFLWARMPIAPDHAVVISEQALARGIWLAPGTYFRPGDEPSAWFRFNVATSDDPALWTFLREIIDTDSGPRQKR
ncbi:GntR family transcriptional regulator [Robbsia andropogonis]|uniref:GntR family transcriptional regulator n=1 Tax=Robbsia andropogonis TaxID=28092 RepID=A0A0F5K7C6_9BURK|nr:PLP-dependent aminotransferase family protein [Robbsia andropogonis]KKB65437.1 GntR family transcriptional regulator [Robbsia andropogonis]MCP1117236.1 PLP-dependent aminotransferase family protein [Robbsia andropogonis]MCP1129370.1 PLP-dependent aminotransferase family protein [Robbsia andropogonis]